MKYSDPIVAIETPTYNRAPSLPATIESIRAQTYPHWRMLIIDDGSTDDTQDIVAPYIKADERIKFLRSEKNCGVAVARNIGLNHLPPEITWITQLDSDDVFLPDALEIMTKTLDQVPKARSLKFTRRWADEPLACARVPEGSMAGYQDRLLKKTPKGEWVNFLHRCFIDQGLRYNERLRRMPGQSFSLHLARLTPSFYFPDVVRVMARDNVSITRPAIKDPKFYREHLNVHEVFFEEFGADLLALSKGHYAMRLAQYASDCAYAGQTKDACRCIFNAITTYPWDRIHLKTLRVILRCLVRSNHIT